MLNFLATLLATLPSILRSRAALELENLALRQQIGVLQRSATKRPKLTPLDRLFWAWLSRIWSDWRLALAIVQPATVLAWHRRGFGLFWCGRFAGPFNEIEELTFPEELFELAHAVAAELLIVKIHAVPRALLAIQDIDYPRLRIPWYQQEQQNRRRKFDPANDLGLLSGAKK